MNPQQMISAARKIESRWPDASIWGNMVGNLKVVTDEYVAYVECRDGAVFDVVQGEEVPEP